MEKEEQMLINDNTYKPVSYNSLSPYLIVDNAQKLVDMLFLVFDTKEMRCFKNEDGKISHMELLIDDTILMLCDSTEKFSATTTMLHVYVQDVFKTFNKAIASGCILIEYPESKQNDPDIRGSFYDLAGNYWAISTQKILYEK